MIRISLCLMLMIALVSVASAQQRNVDIQSLQYEFGRDRVVTPNVTPQPTPIPCKPCESQIVCTPVKRCYTARCCVPVRYCPPVYSACSPCYKTCCYPTVKYRRVVVRPVSYCPYYGCGYRW